MRLIGQFAPALMLAVIANACATTTRAPVTDIPAGTYVLVEPASDVYNAVNINDRAFAGRMGTTTFGGQHWIDRNGRLRMADDAGPCAGQESIWNYQYMSNRVTLTLVEDRCAARATAFPPRMVYERR
ncbi:hypothetical protein BH23GEM9_BH23GEM9_28960 [soil metagenome]